MKIVHAVSNSINNQRYSHCYKHQFFPVMGAIVSFPASLLSALQVIKNLAQAIFCYFKKGEFNKCFWAAKDLAIIFGNNILNICTLGILNCVLLNNFDLLKNENKLTQCQEAQNRKKITDELEIHLEDEKVATGSSSQDSDTKKNIINWCMQKNEPTSYQEAQKRKRVADDLGIDLANIEQEGIATGNGFQDSDVKKNIINWCIEKLETLEYNPRVAAAKKILNCYSLQEIELDLSGYALTSLPENFNPQNLERLNLCLNRLTLLPQNFNPQNLEWLNLNGNELTSLPESFNPQNLECLSLKCNQLTSLPESFNSQNLEELDLIGNELTSLPENFNPQNLKKLYLTGNKLTSLPANFNPQNLKWLYLNGNQNLRELPMSLANCPELTYISVESTQVPPEMAQQILQTCRANRDLEVGDRLPNLLNLWNSYGEGDKKALEFILELPLSDQQILAEWLHRLAQTEDFKWNQKELAKIVYDILLDFTDKDLRTNLLAQIMTNNERCRDRTSMGLNVVYLIWRIWNLEKQGVSEESRKEVFQLMGAIGRTLSLRKILSQMPQMANQAEGVEIYLYYETTLRDKLQLLTAIRKTAYADAIGKKPWINEEQLAQKVLEQHLDEVIDLPVFDRLFKEDETVQKEIQLRQEADGYILEQLDDATASNGLTEQEYTLGADEVQKHQNIWIQELKKNWFLQQVK